MTFFQRIGDFFLSKGVPYEVVFWNGKGIRILLGFGALFLILAIQGTLVKWKWGYNRTYFRHQIGCGVLLAIPIATVFALEPHLSERLVYAMMVVVGCYYLAALFVHYMFLTQYRNMVERGDVGSAIELTGLMALPMILAAGVVIGALTH